MKSKEIKKLINENGIEVPELGIKIIPKPQFEGKISEEIPKELIAHYEILQPLRNIAFESGWEKYSFMKKFEVFVPNNDGASKSNGYLLQMHADPAMISLSPIWIPESRGLDLGFFVYYSFPKNPPSFIQKIISFKN